MPEDNTVINIEHSFIQNAIKQNLRIDNRSNNEFRRLNINFSGDWGCVMVTMGDTKVLAQVSCEIGVPKATRPNEGTLFINVEMSEVACLDSDSNNNEYVLLNRLLERTFKDSHCVDLESLCVRSEEHVWVLRVDVTVLNHDGNLNDVSSIAVLAALMHFRRPDVAIVDDNLRIYRPDEKDYIPLAMQHFPVAVTHCLFNEGKNILVDPLLQEESIAESSIVFGFNSYQELCTLNLSGSTLTDIQVLRQCSKTASKRAADVVNLVKEEIEKDLRKREKGIVGFVELFNEPQSNSSDILKKSTNQKLTKQQSRPLLKRSIDSMETEDKVSDANERKSKNDDNIWLPKSDEVNDDEESNASNSSENS